MATEPQRWEIHSTHPAAEQHAPDPDCTNCDGRGCMGCVMRHQHDECANDCPICCTGNYESTSVMVIPAADYDSLRAEQEAQHNRLSVEHQALRDAVEREAADWRAEASSGTLLTPTSKILRLLADRLDDLLDSNREDA